MKKVKKIITLILIVSMVLSSSMTVLAGEIKPQSTENEINSDDNTIEKGQKTESEQESTSSSAQMLLDFIFVESPIISYEDTQNIAIGLQDVNASYDSVSLKLQDQDGNNILLTEYHILDDLILFQTQQNIGEYLISEVVFIKDGQEIKVKPLDQEIDAHFTVTESTAEQGEEQVEPVLETKVQAINEDGEIEEVDTVEEGLNVVEAGVPDTKFRSRGSVDTGKKVVVIDPGHDKTHTGASVNGMNEQDYTLMIAKACADELRTKYGNIEVYMTVNDNGTCKWGGTTSSCLNSRSNYAKSVNADVFVSMHLNSAGSTSANGSEVYTSNNSSNQSVERQLAQKILEKLVSMGFTNRGVKKADYVVLKNCQSYGIPAILIEHGFMSNVTDANRIKSSATQMGKNNALAIAQQFNLQEKRPGIPGDAFDYSPSGTITAGTSVKLTLNKAKVPSVYNQYQFIYFDKAANAWKDINQFSGTTSVTWKPTKSGEYILGVQAKNSNNEIEQCIKWSYLTVKDLDAEIPGTAFNYSPSGTVTEGTSVKLTLDKSKVPSGYSQYQFIYYDKAANKWLDLNQYSTNTSFTWKPTKAGDYVLGVQAKNSSNKVKQCIKWSYLTVKADNAEIPGTAFNYSLSGTITEGTSVKLNLDKSKVPSGYSQYQFIYYDKAANKWLDLNQYSTNTSFTWKPTKAGDYVLGVQVKNSSNKVKQCIKWSYLTVQSKGYEIMGTTNTTVAQMVKFFQANNSSYDMFPGANSSFNGTLKKGGAATITEFCQMYFEEAKDEGVKAQVAFAQTMLETNFLKYTGDVKPNQYNYAGIGATGGGEPGNSFTSVRIGIRAQIQHLKGYATSEPLNKPCVDPRYQYINPKGKAPTVEGLAGTWAADKNYGEKILKNLSSLSKY